MECEVLDWILLLLHRLEGLCTPTLCLSRWLHKAINTNRSINRFCHICTLLGTLSFPVLLVQSHVLHVMLS
jgi:hypothetical protein